MLESGRLPLDTKVCPENSEDWLAITDLEPASTLQAATVQSGPTSTPEISPARMIKARHAPLAVIVFTLVILGIFLYPRVHNRSLRNCLKGCENYGTVGADAYYNSSFSPGIVVFDLTGGSSAGARRIDPVHLLLQFAAKLDTSSLQRLVLAKGGNQKFYVDASDLRELATSYDNGGRIWAFDHLPERCHDMAGTNPYGTWTGGWLGVAQHQADDLNSFIQEWSGY